VTLNPTQGLSYRLLGLRGTQAQRT